MFFNFFTLFFFRLPEPQAPPFELLPSILTDGLTIAIVSYTMSLSMGLIFAQKFDYEIDPNQELLAMVSNSNKKLQKFFFIS